MKKLKILEQPDRKDDKVLTERGVKNPKVIDLITPIGEDIVEIIMIEERDWSDSQQIPQLEEKYNVYLGYVLDGFFEEQYPQYKSRKIRFVLEYSEEPSGEIKEMLSAMIEYALSEGFDFIVRSSCLVKP